MRDQALPCLSVTADSHGILWDWALAAACLLRPVATQQLLAKRLALMPDQTLPCGPSWVSHVRRIALCPTMEVLTPRPTRRPRQPWEASDGAVLLVRELAAAAPAAVPEFLPMVAELAGLDGFAHCCHLQACSCLEKFIL